MRDSIKSALGLLISSETTMLQQYSIKSIAMYSGIKFKVILKAKSCIQQNKSWNYTVTFDNILLYIATAYADDYQSKIQLLENLTNVRFGLGQLVSPLTDWGRLRDQ